MDKKQIEQTRIDLLKKIQNKNPDITIKIEPYQIHYLNSRAEDSLFFQKLREGKLMGSQCIGCGYIFATPRAYCMECGAITAWKELPLEGKIHSFTVCNFGGEEFLKECPYILVLVAFEHTDTLFLSRLISNKEKTLEKQLLKMDQNKANQFLIGKTVQVQFKDKNNCQGGVTDVYFKLIKGWGE